MSAEERTLGALQAQVARLMQGIEHPRMGAALALAEECGELMRCVLDRECYGKDVAAALEGEVGDVLLSLVEVCDRFGVSLAVAADRAVEKLAKSAPGWRAELGDRMERLRRRVDGADA
jgi:NTP pyrophosphatase (non-canonical NTP hydrolase)